MWGGIAIAGASLLGGLLSSNASQNAAGDQEAAAAIASGAQLSMYNQTRTDLLPAMTSGNAALRSLDALIGITPQPSDTPANVLGGGATGPGGPAGPTGASGTGPANGAPNPYGGGGMGPISGGPGGTMFGGAPDMSGPNSQLPMFGNSPFKSLQKLGNPTQQQQDVTALQASNNANSYWNSPAGQVASYHEQMQADRNANIAQQQVLSGTAFGKMVAKKHGGPIGPGNYVVGEQGRPEIVHLTPGSTGYVVPNPRTIMESLPHRFFGGGIAGATIGEPHTQFNPISGPTNRFGLPVRPAPTPPTPLRVANVPGPAQQTPGPMPQAPVSQLPPGNTSGLPGVPPSMSPPGPGNDTTPIGSRETFPTPSQNTSQTPYTNINQLPPGSALPPGYQHLTNQIAPGVFTGAYFGPGAIGQIPGSQTNPQAPSLPGNDTTPIGSRETFPTPSPGQPGIISLGPRAAPPMPPTGGPVNYPGQQTPAYPYYTPPGGPPASDPTQGNNVALPGSGQTPASIMAQAPQYQFVMQQGIQGLDNSAAARGGLLSGGHIADILNYSQGVASQQFQNIYNNLAQVASLGESAGAMVGNAGTYAGMGMSNALMAGGNAAAAGQVGSANSYNSMLGNLGFMYAMNPNMFGGGTGGGG